MIITCLHLPYRLDLSPDFDGLKNSEIARRTLACDPDPIPMEADVSASRRMRHVTVPSWRPRTPGLSLSFFPGNPGSTASRISEASLRSRSDPDGSRHVCLSPHASCDGAFVEAENTRSLSLSFQAIPDPPRRGGPC